MTEKELHTSDSENEILNADDLKLRQTLGGLKKINAPKDFDFRLKARIANAKPEDFQTALLLPFLRYFVPFSLVLLLAGFVGFNLLQTANQNENSQIAADTTKARGVQEAPQINPQPTAQNSVIAANFTNPTESPSITAENSKPSELVKSENFEKVQPIKVLINKKESATKPKAKKDDEINVIESASTEGKVITPRGVSPNVSAGEPADLNAESKIEVKQVLGFFGISAVFENKTWKVTNVSENSSAFKAGVKNGDLIEALGDVKLTGETINNKLFNVKIIHVIRGGNKMSLEMNK